MRIRYILATVLMLAGPATAQDHAPGHAVAPTTQRSPGWTYHGPSGPEYWGRLDAAYAGCASGQQESPIDLSGAIGADLGVLEIDWPTMAGRAFDTGHAIQVEAAPGGRLMMMGGKTYELLQFHVHQPSEHLLDGRRFPLEIHFVHTAPDGTLGVVGVFAEAGEANPTLQAVLDAVAAGPDAMRPTLDPTALLPDSRDHFRYEGSLTTPPCSETVDWAVLAQPISVSAAQIETFTRLHPGNTRPLQPLNRRFLLRSRD